MKKNKCYNLGLLDGPQMESVRRVYHWGASPTLNTYAGRDVKIMVYEDAHDVRDER